MLKTIDSIFSLNTQKSEDLSFDTEFIYNYYEENETVVDDSKIIVSDFSYKKKRFIRLKFENLNQNDKADYNADNFVESVYNLSQINTLSLQEIKYFNKIDKLIPKRKFVTTRLDSKEKNLISSYYNKEKNSPFSNKIMYNHRISYLSPEYFDNNLNIVNLNSFFPESGIYKNDKVYSNVLYKDTSKAVDNPTENFELNSNGSQFNNLLPIEKTVNEITEYSVDFSKYNAIRCGILIEKFLVENEEYTFLCGKFISKSKNQSNLYISNSIEDEAVGYGKTYMYAVYNVYLYAEVDSADKCILNKYLICDHPVFSNEIDCLEKEPPPPPKNLKFMVTGERNLEIKWDEPSDYQYDAKGYQILKRSSLNEGFTVIGQLEGHNSNDLYAPEESVSDELIIKTPGEVRYRFVDNDYQKGKITIYAIRTIDAHGYFSDYSDQVAIIYDPFKQKIIYDLVSHSGAKRNMPNEKLLNKTLFFDYDDKIIDNLPMTKNIKNIKLYITPDYCQINTSEGNSHNVFQNDEEFKFTIFRLNDLVKYEKHFKIKNFIQ